MMSEDVAAIESIVAKLERAWNAGDAAGFAAPFAIDGDQVNIFGTVLKGRAEIAERHDRIFKTIFLGSHNTLRLVETRRVSDNVVLARMHSRVDVPQGPLAGELQTLASLLFRKMDEGWELVTFHNTRIDD
jgi:uncharacterized protein (TIGR02246 family)